VVNAGYNNMLVRLFFDAGRTWKSLYFSDVSEQQVNKIKSAFASGTAPCCWHSVAVSENNNVLEIRVDFRRHVHFDCLDGADAWEEGWVRKAREMNKGLIKCPKSHVLDVMLNNEARARSGCCVENFKSGKCKNPFVVENLGCVLLPKLYPNAKQK